ncbi:MAG: dihydroorotate dehydrogenase [Prevotellaceae bacterium]|jgi:dihydroorotate dehydrogenase (NAD+) catalytic subunit|nr:dihydroorotate dehydrogenase [Prevotellaceae bacterium]MDY3856209.1 dihydroorotate dehydrogenase [Bacteroidaceae bacterium]
MVTTNRLAVELGSVRLQNPIIPASGTFGFGYEMAQVYDIDILGSISIKGTTALPRYGNPLPRIAEAPSGLLNAVGLQNPGVDQVISNELPKLRACFHQPIIANVSGFSIQDYVQTCQKMDAEEQVAILEVNISCPNVHGGGLAFGTSPEQAAAVTRAVKAVTHKPVYLKLSPNVTDIVSIARACVDAGANGLTLINTLMGMRIDPRRRQPVLANTTGGLSGPAILPLAIRMVYQVAQACPVPIIGCGGVSTARDVIEMMMAGATAVQVGAANLRRPMACKEIIEQLPAELDRLKIDHISDIIGAALPKS